MQFPDIADKSHPNKLNFCPQEIEGKKSYFGDTPSFSLSNYRLYATFSYDADALRDQVAPASIFTLRRNLPSVPGLLNEHLANIDASTPNIAMKNKENIHDNQSELHTQLLPGNLKSISFYALVKEQSPTNNFEVGDLEKTEPGNIYASKYYPSRSNYTDHGHILNLEARIELPVLENWHEHLQLIVFVDTSPITMDQYSWASELNRTTINGAGFGISRSYADNFALQVYFANELESQVIAIPPTLSHLFWIHAVKYF